MKTITNLLLVVICLQYSPTSTLEVNESSQNGTNTKLYTLTVYTGDRVGAGTDAKVFLSLIGDHGQSSSIELTSLNRDLFERNEIDTFLISVNDIGKIQWLNLSHDGSNAGSGWFLDKVTLSTEEGDYYEFPYYAWIPESDHITSVQLSPTKSEFVKRSSLQRNEGEKKNFNEPQPLECSSALGMGTKSNAVSRIPDNKITASTSFNDLHLPFHARLNQVVGDSLGGWCPFRESPSEYLQVEFPKLTRITGIATQGMALVDEWTTMYYIQYSTQPSSEIESNLDMKDWKNLTSATSPSVTNNEQQPAVELDGNVDQNTTVLHWFSGEKSFVARRIRIIPIKYHGKSCLRIELYGCDENEYMRKAGKNLNLQSKSDRFWNTSFSGSEIASKRNSGMDWSSYWKNISYLQGNPPVLYLDFEKPEKHSYDEKIGEDAQNMIIDKSGHSNHLRIIAPVDWIMASVSCGMAMHLNGGELRIDGEFFMGKPRDAVTLLMWLKLKSRVGIHTIFSTFSSSSSSQSKSKLGYLLEVNNERLRWIHRNESGFVCFNLTTGMIIPIHTWFHVAVDYNASTQTSRIFLDGDQVAKDISASQCLLTQDWRSGASIGRFMGQRVLNGELDEFYIFSRTLSDNGIRSVMKQCKMQQNCGTNSLNTQSQDSFPDYNYAATSTYNLHKPYYARLNMVGNMGDPARTAWCAESTDPAPKLQISFNQTKSITGVSIQGLGLFDNWPTGFMFCYALRNNTNFSSSNMVQHQSVFQDISNISCIQDMYHGNEIFSGNTDRDSVKTHKFISPVLADVVEIHSVSWFGNHLCLRLELYGCDWDLYDDPFDSVLDIESYFSSILDSDAVARSHVSDNESVMLPAASGYETCENTPLGVTSGEIEDLRMTASSELSINHQARFGRILSNAKNSETVKFGTYFKTSTRCWCSKESNLRQYLEIDLGDVIYVTGIATQGQITDNNWVTKYRLGYADNLGPIHWYSQHGDEKIFSGNSNRSDVVRNKFEKPFKAKFLRINPREWNGEHICLRVEIFGCQDKGKPPENLNSKLEVKPSIVRKNDSEPFNNTNSTINTTLVSKKIQNKTISEQSKMRERSNITFQSTTTVSTEKYTSTPGPIHNKSDSNVKDFVMWNDLLRKYPELKRHGVTPELLNALHHVTPNLKEKIETYFDSIAESLNTNNTMNANPYDSLYHEFGNHQQAPQESGIHRDVVLQNAITQETPLYPPFQFQPENINWSPEAVNHFITTTTPAPSTEISPIENRFVWPEHASFTWQDPNPNVWGTFTSCSKPCGLGVKMRIRKCDVPLCPSPGTETETIPCMETICTDVVSQKFQNKWSPFSACTANCGVGKSRRYRICDGTNCPPPGYQSQVVACWRPKCPVLLLDFELFEGDLPHPHLIIDRSGLGNHAILIDKGQILSHDESCGHYLDLSFSGRLELSERTFRSKPVLAITISLWIKLKPFESTSKNLPTRMRSIFATEYFQDAETYSGGYHLEITEEGRVRWFHRDSFNRTVFSTLTSNPVLIENVWMHLTVTYDSSTLDSIVYIDGLEVHRQRSGEKYLVLSKDWGVRAIIGDYDYDSRALQGSIDDFLIYDYALTNAQVMKIISDRSSQCNYQPPYTKVEQVPNENSYQYNIIKQNSESNAINLY